jgi:hypothetical protein
MFQLNILEFIFFALIVKCKRNLVPFFHIETQIPFVNAVVPLLDLLAYTFEIVLFLKSIRRSTNYFKYFNLEIEWSLLFYKALPP